MHARMRAPFAIIPALALACSALAQPPHEPPREPGQRDPAHAEPPRDNDPTALKARLERWLEETRHREESIQAALKKLSDGASPEDVRRSLDAGIRPRLNTPRQPDSRPQDPRAHREPPTPEPDREQVLAFIEKQNPEFAGRLRAMIKDRPEAGDRVFSRLTPQIHEILAERDATTREIRTAQLKNGWDVMSAIGQARDAGRKGETDARAKAVERIRTLIGEGFDLRVRLHEREVAVLEERVTKLKQELATERETRESFIADRVKAATEPREPRPRGEPRPDGESKKPEPHHDSP